MLILDAVVVGAGQAGLSTSYHLRRRGLEHVVLDADPEPGGAWRHRWDSLTMGDVHGVAFDASSRLLFHEAWIEAAS